MQVILLQDVANLGYKNDIVKVRDGYGRNYLIPNKFAIVANESNVKILNENLKQQARKLAALKADAEAKAAQIGQLNLTIAAKAAENGKLFGTVTTAQIADALNAAGIAVDKKVIAIHEQVKELGNYKAEAKLHKEVKAEISFTVVAEAAE